MGGARGRTHGGARELVQEPLVLTIDASHLVAGKGVVLMALTCSAPEAADGGVAGSGDEQHPVQKPACARHGWRRGGRERKTRTKHGLFTKYGQ